MQASNQKDGADQAGQTTVLIVDDEPVNAHLISKLLVGYEVIVALNGRDGISMAVDEKPDLILLDINMPDLTGFEVCENLRANPVTRDIPIMFLTTMDAAADKVRAFEVGGNDYIVKPYSKEEVAARVNAHLGLRRLHLQMESRNRQLLRYKEFMEQLLVERLTGDCGSSPEDSDFRNLLTVIETLAQVDEAQRETATPEIIAELEEIRAEVRKITTRLNPLLKKLRRDLEAAAAEAA